MKNIEILLTTINAGQKAYIRLQSCTGTEFVQELLALVAGIDLEKLTTGHLNESDWQVLAIAASKIGRSGLNIIEKEEEKDIPTGSLMIDV